MTQKSTSWKVLETALSHLKMVRDKSKFMFNVKQ